MKKFTVYTTTQWLQEYEVEAETVEAACQAVLCGSNNIKSVDGEYMFDTEVIHSIEEIKKED